MAGPFKPGMTPERVAGTLVNYDLAEKPESLRDLLAELLLEPPKTATPWGEMELHEVRGDQGPSLIRESRSRPEGDPDVHILTPDASVRWDAANWQMNVDSRDANQMAVSSFDDFRRQVDLKTVLPNAKSETSIEDDRSVATLTDQRTGRSLVVDEATGYLCATRRTRPKCPHAVLAKLD